MADLTHKRNPRSASTFTSIQELHAGVSLLLTSKERNADVFLLLLS